MQHLQASPTDRALLPAYVDHDSRLTIGNRDRDVSPTTAAVSSGSTTTRPSTSSHGTSRKWSGSGVPSTVVASGRPTTSRSTGT